MDLLGTYHILFEVSPLEAMKLPPQFIKDLIEWKTKYLQKLNEEIEEQLKDI